MLKSTPVRMFGVAVFTTIDHVVCHFVAPNANDASLKSSGIAFKLSTVALKIVGSIRIASVKLPESSDILKPKEF